VHVVTLKGAVKTVLRPLVLASWPAVESIAGLSAQYAGNGLKVRWSRTWDRDLDEALAQLPPFEDCSHDMYRELVQPTQVPKQHALVLEHGVPIAQISLRRRKRFWEPVTYQCLPKAIAPATSMSMLGRALNALGTEVHVPAGIGEEIGELNARQSWSYEWYGVDLQGDYEGYWRSKKRMYTIRRARQRCAEMERRINGEGDLEWIIAQWREQWADDPGQEVVATEDRLRFWGALARSRDKGRMQLHTLQLLAGNRRVAGLVFTSSDQTVMLQCGGRDPEFDDSYSRAALHLSAIDWAAGNGFRYLDLAGGDWKRHWGPPGGVRHGAIFRSPIIEALSWANSD
jgi:hypothetical protein